MPAAMITDILQQFSRKEVGSDAVLRALVSHDGWFAPAAYAYTAFKKDHFEKVTLWGSETKLPPGQLWFFTGPEHGEMAQQKGAMLGAYTSPLDGATLFGSLEGSGFVEVKVNPGSPSEQGFFIGKSGFDLVRRWARAIRLEQMLVGKREGNLIDELIDFDGLISFSLPNGAIATAVGAGGLKNPGLVFTAPDSAEKLKASVGAQAQLKMIVCDGKTLFGRFSTFGIDGFIFNAMGPGAGKVFDAKICQALQGSVESRAELSRLEAATRES